MPTGQFQDRPGQGNCEICAKNSFANTTGEVSCYQCPANTVTAERGSTALSDCVCQVRMCCKQGMLRVCWVC